LNQSISGLNKYPKFNC